MTICERAAVQASERGPGPTTLDEIIAMTDPVLRNLWITQSYHEFAVGLRDAGAGDDATWCAFAVWASKTAGLTIRGDELPARVRRLLLDVRAGGTVASTVVGRFNGRLEGVLLQKLSRGDLIGLVETVSADVAATIAAGNLLVFAELAPLFTALLDAWTDPAFGSNKPATALDPVLDAVRANATDPNAMEAVFRLYWQALGEPDDRVGAGLVLAANVAAVAHEQQRLQPAIASALDAAIRDSLQKLIIDELAPHLPGTEVRHLVVRVADELCEVMDGVWQAALTGMMMELFTADERLDLRRDVPLLAGVLFPEDLAVVEVAEAVCQLQLWDRTGGTGKGSGARDWAVLAQRMNYIVNLFRSRQRHLPLFDPPFTDIQLDALRQGTLPSGPL